MQNSIYSLLNTFSKENILFQRWIHISCDKCRHILVIKAVTECVCHFLSFFDFLCTPPLHSYNRSSGSSIKKHTWTKVH